MLISMTGFGEARGESGDMAVVVEVRTINSRHLKLSFRSSDGYAGLEPEIDAVVRDLIRRGTVQLNLYVNRQVSADDYRINAAVIDSYRSQLDSIVGRDDNWSDQVDLRMLLGLPGVVNERTHSDHDPHDDWPVIEPVVRQAVSALAQMRRDEGAALTRDLTENGYQIEQLLGKIAQRAPEVVVSYQSRLTQRVQQALSDLNVTVNPADLVREVSLFVDRSDISEEIVRLRSHLQQFNEALGLAESSGRKLEFIAQEMGREINTIGSKANDAEISRYVVDIKSALERIREQIQNVE